LNTTLRGGAEGGRSTQVFTGLGEVARNNWVLTATALALLGGAVFGPMLGDFFWLDDLTWLYAIQSTPPGQRLLAAFLPPFPVRPVAFLTFGLLVPLCGCEPAGYRAVSLGLHIINGLLVYAFARRLLGDRRPALAATLIWFVYPAHRWAVLWIADLAGLLLTAFALTSLLLFWRALEAPSGTARRLYYGLALATFVLALLSKESSLTLAFLFPALAWMAQPALRAPGKTGDGGRQTREDERGKLIHLPSSVGRFAPVLPVFVLTGLYLVMQGLAYQTRPGAEGYALLSPQRTAGNLSKALIFLVNPFIPFNLLNTMHVGAAVALASAVAVVGGLAVGRWGRREGWFLSAWVVLTLLPVALAAGFLAPFRGRYLYLVSIGYILLLTWLIWPIVRHFSSIMSRPPTAMRPLAAGALALLLIGLAAFNMSQQSIVRDDPINALRRWTWGGIMGCPATEAMRARERSWEGADFRRAAQGFDQLALQTQLTAIDVLSRGLAYELAGDPAHAAADYRAGLALVPPTGFDSRSVSGGYYAPYERIASYVQTRLDALERTEDR